MTKSGKIASPNQSIRPPGTDTGTSTAVDDNTDIHTGTTTTTATATATETMRNDFENNDQQQQQRQQQGQQEQNSHSLEKQKLIWKLEQSVVSSMIEVPDESSSTSTTKLIEENSLFHLIPDDHHDIYSFSSKPEYYGGVDVGFPDKDDPDQRAVAVYVIINRITMKVIYQEYEYFLLDIPYIPTYLAFREIAPLERLVRRQLSERPDITPTAILVDGNGVLHPRHAGIACFLGTRVDIPTIGIGKTLLYEGGWTREYLDETIDTFLLKLCTFLELENKNKEGTDGDDNINNDNMKNGISKILSKYRGVIMKHDKDHIHDVIDMNHGNQPSLGPTSTSNSSTSHPLLPKDWDRKKILQDLAPFCIGIGIPLENMLLVRNDTDAVDKNKNDDDADGHGQDEETAYSSRFPILAYALIGHGGKIAKSNKSLPIGGTIRPIFVSIGHKVSLERAVQITASISPSRIPEPVRQADLLGRELLRRRNTMNQSKSTSSS